MSNRTKNSENEGEHGLSPSENREVEEQTNVSSRVVYQTVRAEGDEEIARPIGSLWWSGLAAGIAISASVFVQGFLQGYLPDAPWRPLIVKVGYSVGFLIVVLGRMQLFTETTVTAVLPLLVERSMNALWRTARLWGIVFVANLAGTALAALMAIHTHLATPQQLAIFYEVAEPLVDKTWLDVLMQGVPAGFLIAAMVWMLAATKSGHFWVIAVMAYVIALGDFAHVVVGSTEVFLLMFSGQTSVLHGVLGVLLPALVGNIVGGTGLFAVLAYGQVKQEIESATIKR